ncbi:MAG: hypothetical protein ACYSWP_18710 [Planctomycetota bacterium]|jgi:hypothetical protein
MDSINIKISGMGMTMDNEIEIIKDSLINHGYSNIEVRNEDDYNPNGKTNLDKKIIITIKNNPWPG